MYTSIAIVSTWCGVGCGWLVIAIYQERWWYIQPNICVVSVYLSLPPTRHDLTHGQKPESRLKTSATVLWQLIYSYMYTMWAYLHSTYRCIQICISISCWYFPIKAFLSNVLPSPHSWLQILLVSTNEYYSILIIYLQTVKWLQVLLFNTNHSIQQYSLICSQTNGSKYCYVIPIIHLKSFKYCSSTLIILFNIAHLFAHS